MIPRIGSVHLVCYRPKASPFIIHITRGLLISRKSGATISSLKIQKWRGEHSGSMRFCSTPRKSPPVSLSTLDGLHGSCRRFQRMAMSGSIRALRSFTSSSIARADAYLSMTGSFNRRPTRRQSQRPDPSVFPGSVVFYRLSYMTKHCSSPPAVAHLGRWACDTIMIGKLLR